MQPELIQKLLKAATACFRAEDFASASILYREILHHDTNNAQALMMLGVISQRAGKTEEALHFLEMARSAAPERAAIWISNALALGQAGRLEEAQELAEIGLSLDPTSPEALDTAGFFARENSHTKLSNQRHEKAVDAAPDNPAFLSHYAIALLGMGELKKAYNTAINALRGAPNDGAIHMTLGLILRASGYPDRAILAFQKAQTLIPQKDPQRKIAFLEEGKTHLLQGAFSKGWNLFNAHKPLCQSPIPLWDGRKIKHLLLIPENNFDDTLFYLRYLVTPFIQKKATQLTLKIERKAHPIIQENLPGLTLLAPEDPLPKADAYIPLSFLPKLTETTLETIPPALVLSPSTKTKDRWQEKLKDMDRPRIGLAWREPKKDPLDTTPPLSIEDVAPFSKKFSKHLISFQKQSTEAYLHARDEDFSLEDQAALLSCLDLLITTDGPLAHMAGSMGIPVWIFVPFSPTWHWLYDRQDSPWYPNFRLFRQKSPKDWTSIIDEMMRELEIIIQHKEPIMLNDNIPSPQTASRPAEPFSLHSQ